MPFVCVGKRLIVTLYWNSVSNDREIVGIAGRIVGDVVLVHGIGRSAEEEAHEKGLILQLRKKIKSNPKTTLRSCISKITVRDLCVLLAAPRHSHRNKLLQRYIDFPQGATVFMTPLSLQTIGVDLSTFANRFVVCFTSEMTLAQFNRAKEYIGPFKHELVSRKSCTSIILTAEHNF